MSDSDRDSCFAALGDSCEEVISSPAPMETRKTKLDLSDLYKRFVEPKLEQHVLFHSATKAQYETLPVPLEAFMPPREDLSSSIGKDRKRPMTESSHHGSKKPKLERVRKMKRRKPARVRRRKRPNLVCVEEMLRDLTGQTANLTLHRGFNFNAPANGNQDTGETVVPNRAAVFFRQFAVTAAQFSETASHAAKFLDRWARIACRIVLIFNRDNLIGFFANNVAEIAVGIATVADGVAIVADGSARLADGGARVAVGEVGVNEVIFEVATGIGKVSDGFAKVTDGVAKVTDVVTKVSGDDAKGDNELAVDEL